MRQFASSPARRAGESLPVITGFGQQCYKVLIELLRFVDTGYRSFDSGLDCFQIPAHGSRRMKRLSLLLILPFTFMAMAHAAEVSFYIGTYTKPGGSQGIYRGTLDTETGAAKVVGLAGEATKPSFLALHPSGKYLYSVIEAGGGAVAAFAVEADGKLRKLNEESSKGGGNCHVWVHPNGKYVFAANYGTGSIACLPIKEDGSVAPASSSIQHVGTGPNKGRQQGPHAHAIYVNGDFVYACDLGTDDVFVYKFDAAKGTLTPNDPPSGKVPPGGGPRHLAFHPKGGFAYVNNEMTSAVTAFAHDAAKGTLQPLQTLSTLPEGYADAAKNSTAEIFCHPNGKFVYVSNRGHDSIAVYAIGTDGKLTTVEIADAHVKVPRGFALSPDGKWLIAGGQNSDNLALHKVDPATGKLTFQKIIGEVGSPVNVEFVK
jgi:6-phosphogluconolactonase